MPWWFYALLSALAAAATAVFAKAGTADVPSNLATALRTSVVLLFSWTIVLARHEQRGLHALAGRTALFLLASGVATGLSWLAYFRALQLAPVTAVAPLDKLSLPLTFVMAFLILGERVSVQAALGAGLMVIGALLTLRG